jgi:hypothetical protein
MISDITNGYSQQCEKDSIPKLLRKDEIVAGPRPMAIDLLLANGKTDEDPYASNRKPAGKTMMVLKDTTATVSSAWCMRQDGNTLVVLLANWWKRGKDNNSNHDRDNDSQGEHCRVVHAMITEGQYSGVL